MIIRILSIFDNCMLWSRMLLPRSFDSFPCYGNFNVNGFVFVDFFSTSSIFISFNIFASSLFNVFCFPSICCFKTLSRIRDSSDISAVASISSNTLKYFSSKRPNDRLELLVNVQDLHSKTSCNSFMILYYRILIANIFGYFHYWALDTIRYETSTSVHTRSQFIYTEHSTLVYTDIYTFLKIQHLYILEVNLYTFLSKNFFLTFSSIFYKSA